MTRVLIVKLSAIGDIVMATPAARAVKEAVPQSYVCWAADTRFAELVRGNPDVDEVICWARNSGVVGAWHAGREVRSRRFHVVMDLQGNGKSSILVRLSGAPRRIGYRRAREKAHLAYNERVECPAFPHGMSCHQELLRAFAPNAQFRHSAMHVPVTEQDRRFASDLLRTTVGDGSRFAVFFPATTRANKHWPVEHWSRLADLMEQELGLVPLFLGSPADKPLVNCILSPVAGQAASAVGSTTLLQAAALIERASLAVGVDTGLLHIAQAVKRPTIGLFGPSDAWLNHDGVDGFRALREPMDCSPCRRSPTCRDFDCMRAIRPEAVLAACAEMAGVAA